MTTTEFNIEALPVKITYVAEVPSKWDETKKATVDQWRVTITSPAGFHAFDYFTGLGLRTRTYSGYGRKWDAMRKRHFDDKPKAPTVADVLYSLFSDARAADENFHDWCDNYGYSTDSIKAMNTYTECLETARALRKHFDPTTRANIETIIQEM